MGAGNLNGNNDIGPLAARILQWQGAVSVVLAVLAGLGWGWYAGLSAIAGGAIGLVANLYMTMKALKPANSPQGALGGLMLGQLVKVAITVGLFWVASRQAWMSWPALLIGYLGTLVVFWWVPYRSSGQVQGRSARWP
jgi:F0F1-type ATP synthase assembly protein I